MSLSLEASSAPASGPAASAPQVAVNAGAVGGAQVLRVRGVPLLEVGADGTASGTFRLCNADTKSTKLQLAAEPFVMDGGAQQLLYLNTTIRFAGETPTDKPAVETGADLAAGRCVGVRMDVAKFWQPGRATAVVTNEGAELLRIHAARHQAPFDIQVDGTPSDSMKLSIAKGEPALLRLLNNDPVNYTFRWQLSLGDRVCQGISRVAAKGHVQLPVLLDEKDFGWFDSGFLRAGRREGRLLLRHEPDTALAAQPLATRSIPVAATLGYYGNGAWQYLLNTLFVAVVLLAGILLSLAINYGLPMQRRRVALRQRLADEDARITGRGDGLGSRTLQALRIERQRLVDAEERLWPVMPEAEEAMPRLEARTDLLVRRTDLALAALGHLATIRADGALPWHEADRIAELCTSVLRIAEQATLTDAELQRANEHLVGATALLNGACQNPTADTVAALQQRVNDLKQRIDALNTLATGAQQGTFGPLWEEIKPMLTALEGRFLQNGGTVPLCADYVRADQAVWKAEVLVDYAHLVAHAENAAVRQARIDRKDDLLSALTPGAAASARRARSVLRQIEQNVTTADIVAALNKRPPWIEADPLTPATLQLVTLRLRMAPPALEAAEARYDIKCSWTINDKPVEGEDGWLIHDYFDAGWRAKEKDLKHTIKVKLLDSGLKLPTGQTLPEVEPKPLQLRTSTNFLKRSTKLSIYSLAITVFLITVGLLSAAQEKLQSLDWISGVVALLVLGFGADVIKRTLASKP